jgi:hypothetical protein
MQTRDQLHVLTTLPLEPLNTTGCLRKRKSIHGTELLRFEQKVDYKTGKAKGQRELSLLSLVQQRKMFLSSPVNAYKECFLEGETLSHYSRDEHH